MNIDTIPWAILRDAAILQLRSVPINRCLSKCARLGVVAIIATVQFQRCRTAREIPQKTNKEIRFLFPATASLRFASLGISMKLLTCQLILSDSTTRIRNRTSNVCETLATIWKFVCYQSFEMSEVLALVWNVSCVSNAVKSLTYYHCSKMSDV